ncbi:hypothetical protein LguiA_024656 [Lonicera macranthoides]
MWNCKSNTPHSIISKVFDNLHQWKSANAAPYHDNQTVSNREVKWQKPLSDWVKCNTEASLFSSPSRSGFAAVLRDSKGTFMVAFDARSTLSSDGRGYGHA